MVGLVEITGNYDLGTLTIGFWGHGVTCYVANGVFNVVFPAILNVGFGFEHHGVFVGVIVYGWVAIFTMGCATNVQGATFFVVGGGSCCAIAGLYVGFNENWFITILQLNDGIGVGPQLEYALAFTSLVARYAGTEGRGYGYRGGYGGFWPHCELFVVV